MNSHPDQIPPARPGILGKPRRRKVRPGRRRRPQENRDLTEAGKILGRLDALAGELLRRELMGQAPLRPVGSLPLDITVFPDRSDRSDRSTDIDTRPRILLEQLRERIQEVGDGVIALRPGRIYCYWCKSNACHHGLPMTPREVFIGYDPTGRPRFNDFADLALARRDPRIEGLYRDPPEPMAIYENGAALRADQLQVFGGRSVVFNILGQVAIGYFPFKAKRSGEREVFSLTLQAIETRRRDGGTLLDLNILGRIPEGTLQQWIDEAFDGAMLRTVRQARRRIREVGRKNRGRQNRGELEALVEPHLNELARTLERFPRQVVRRTSHVQNRRRQGNRPTRKALEDARSAQADALFRDEKHGTYVVLGPRGRTHVFSTEGRHITSVTYSREAVERKQKQKIWRVLDTEEEAGFRGIVQ